MEEFTSFQEINYNCVYSLVFPWFVSLVKQVICNSITGTIKYFEFL